MSNKWTHLSPGDTVDLVAPGFRCSANELKLAAAFLESWDLKPKFPKNIFSGNGLFSNSDKFRLNHLSNSLTNKTSKAVWALRGGYGSLRLLPGLENLNSPNMSKLFIGFSDITSLHIFLVQKWKWNVIHGPLLDRLGKGDVTQKVLKELKGIIFGTKKEIKFSGLIPLNRIAKNKNTISGKIMGGNLAVIQSSIGTSWQLKGKNTILFFEDVGERGYKIDRMLNHLRLAGVFNSTKAVIFGNFNGGYESNGRTTYHSVIEEFANQMDLPVLKGLKTGHGRVQLPVPMGGTGTLLTGEKGILRVGS